MDTRHPTPALLGSVEFAADALTREHPPRFRNDNKRLVHAIACPEGATHRGAIRCTRWRALSLSPLAWPGSRCELEVHEGVFDYGAESESRGVPWTMNFAHSDLFCAYGGHPFAQDEIQVAEHPALASLREALLARLMGPGDATDELLPCTVAAGQPTPVLIAGVERRCVVETDINPERGRPLGLYGRRFARAPADAVRQATTRLEPPTVSNILAMEAPACLHGPYSEDQLEFILQTAITGFAAARASSAPSATTIHTGFWGCGAYGGDRTLMAMLQLIAADVAGVDRVVFHTVDRAGGVPLKRAHAVLETLAGALGSGVPLPELAACVAQMGFRWGVSDGN